MIKVISNKDPDVLKIYNDTKKFNIGTNIIIEKVNGSTNNYKKTNMQKNHRARKER